MIIILIQIVIPYESVVVCCLSEEEEQRCRGGGGKRSRDEKRLGMEMGRSRSGRGKDGTGNNSNSVAETEKGMMEGNTHRLTKEKRERANEERLSISFSLFIPVASFVSFILIHLDSICPDLFASTRTHLVLCSSCFG